ncbi:hypothetical protein Dsin_006358 [Dipteronia sinensis]|uniref:RNase H type-1 domain-containing protein n=1 Tax=Dipteronia sinensis TaxID=43782 RepID=A0AAE0AY99_9ROSI|nr:hypothetical protein Dsin_006358 [Dipteronia sinensis]
MLCGVATRLRKSGESFGNYNASLVLDFLLSCRYRLVTEKFEVVCIILWKHWYLRDNIVHRSLSLCDFYLVSWSYSFLEDYQSANKRVDVLPLEENMVSNSWSPPVEGLFKLNNGASIDEKGGKMSIGIIICNGDGLVLGSGAQPINALFSPLVAEAMEVFWVL